MNGEFLYDLSLAAGLFVGLTIMMLRIRASDRAAAEEVRVADRAAAAEVRAADRAAAEELRAADRAAAEELRAAAEEVRAADRAAAEELRAAEERVMLGLAEYDLADAFRARHGYRGIQYEIPDDPRSANQFSWATPQNPNIRRRFDHIFSSRSLPPAECDYLHKPREDGLSVHSPIYALFQPA